MSASLLEKAFAEVSKLSPEEQNKFAAWILEELSERRWQKRFAETGDALDKLADEALPEQRAMSREEWVAFVNATYGSLADDPIERGPQGDYEKRDETE